VKALGEVGTLRIGTLAIAAGLLTLPLANSLASLAVTAVFMPLGTALLFPATTSLVSKRYGPYDTGSALGVQQAFGGTARLIGPLWSTLAYERGQTLPFWIAGGVMVLVCLYALKVRGADPVVNPLSEVESPSATV
jgi:MFS family permease